MSKYTWREGMGEISGLGGDYEEACRDMVRAGMEWLDAHPDADPRFRGYTGVYGLILESNADAKALSKALCDAPLVKKGGGATGAMHQATVTACLYIRKHGWEKYVEEMSKKSEKN